MQLSLNEAAAHPRIDCAPRVLRRDAETGVVRALQIGRKGVPYRFDQAQLEEDCDRAGVCGFEGCTRAALAGLGCHRHEKALRERGSERDPAIVAEIAQKAKERAVEHLGPLPLCEWCGKERVKRRGNRYCSKSHSALAREERERGRAPNILGRLEHTRRGRVVTCWCGRTTRYLSPSLAAVLTYCRHCYSSAEPVRAKRSESMKTWAASPAGRAHLAAVAPLRRAGHSGWRARRAAEIEARGLLDTTAIASALVMDPRQVVAELAASNFAGERIALLGGQKEWAMTAPNLEEAMRSVARSPRRNLALDPTWRASLLAGVRGGELSHTEAQRVAGVAELQRSVLRLHRSPGRAPDPEAAARDARWLEAYDEIRDWYEREVLAGLVAKMPTDRHIRWEVARADDDLRASFPALDDRSSTDAHRAIARVAAAERRR